METEHIIQLVTAILGSSIITSLVNMLMNRYRHDYKTEKARALYEEIQLAAKAGGGEASEAERILARFIRADIEERLITAVVPSDKATSALLLGGSFLSLTFGIATLGTVPAGTSILLFAAALLALSGYVVEFRIVNGLRAILLSLMRSDSDPPVAGLPRRYRNWVEKSDSDEDYTFGVVTRQFVASSVRTEVAGLIRTCRQARDRPPSIDSLDPSASSGQESGTALPLAEGQRDNNA